MEDYNEIKAQITKEANNYLEKFELKFSYGDNVDIVKKDWIGMYEYNSISFGTIVVYINDDELIDAAFEEDDLESDLRVTVFHEIGHAFMEYVNELPDEVIEPYFKDFFDVFYDDNGVSEEDLCEDFGYSFDSEHYYLSDSSLLRELIEKMLRDGIKFS